jgi:hypothetical protein
MVDLVETALTGRAGPPTTSVRDQLQALQREHGSGRAAARQMGISEGTWRRWWAGAGLPAPKGGTGSKGAKPSGKNQAKLAAAAAAPLRAAAIVNRPSDQTIRHPGRHRGADHRRVRTATATSMRIRPGTADAITDAYVTGGAAAAAAALQRGIGDDFWRDFFFDDDMRGEEVTDPDDDSGSGVAGTVAF